MHFLRKWEIIHGKRRMYKSPARSLRVETGKFSCFYAASTSRKIHAIIRNKSQKLKVTSPAGCRLTYLQFSVEYTRNVVADCLQLPVFLLVIAGIFGWFCGYFYLRFLVFLPANCMHFLLQKQAILHASRGRICISSECKITCKMPSKFRYFYTRLQVIALILCEVLAA